MNPEVDQTLTTTQNLYSNKKIMVGVGVVVALIAIVLIIWKIYFSEVRKNTVVLSQNNIALSNSSVDYRPYSSAKYGFEINAPKNWIVDESESDTVYFTSNQTDANDFSTNINVYQDSSNGLDLKDYVDGSIEMLPRALTNYKLMDNRPTEVNGIEARIISGTFIQGSYHLINMQLVVIKDSKAYIITGTTTESTWDKYKDVIESSLLTFKII